MSLFYCCTTARIAWLLQQHKCWNKLAFLIMRFVTFIIHQGLENIETFLSRPRPRPRLFLQDQDQDQDYYFKTKTKTKTTFHVLEVPRDQDQGLKTTSLILDVFKYRYHKIFFTERVVNLWNSLPPLVVEAPSLNCFKTRLDKFWSNQDAVSDFKAPFLGTGSRRSYS